MTERKLGREREGLKDVAWESVTEEGKGDAKEVVMGNLSEEWRGEMMGGGREDPREVMREETKEESRERAKGAETVGVMDRGKGATKGGKRGQEMVK
jgi:hypothetical protein